MEDAETLGSLSHVLSPLIVIFSLTEWYLSLRPQSIMGESLTSHTGSGETQNAAAVSHPDEWLS